MGNLWDEQEGALRLVFADKTTITAGYSRDNWAMVEVDFANLEAHHHWALMFAHANIITYTNEYNEYITIHNERIIGYGFLLVDNIMPTIESLPINQQMSDEAHNRHDFDWRREEYFLSSPLKHITYKNQRAEVRSITRFRREK